MEMFLKLMLVVTITVSCIQEPDKRVICKDKDGAVYQYVGGELVAE